MKHHGTPVTQYASKEDLELHPVPSAHLQNEFVRSFAWREMNVTVKDRVTKDEKFILTDANGLMRGGEMLAIMGPSGSSVRLHCSIPLLIEQRQQGLSHREMSSSMDSLSTGRN